jgi:ribonuclease-3
MKHPLRQLEKNLGYRFRRRRHLEYALTHRSYRYENEEVDHDNQRLEFLGDAVLGLVTAAYLHDRFPDLQEGEMTKIRSQVSSSNALYDMAVRTDLGRYLRLGRGEEQSGGRERKSNLADAMEAVLGAAYLDGGIKASEKVFRKLIRPVILEGLVAPESDNPKGALQELVQSRWKTVPKYRVVSERGPSHARRYTARVFIGDEAFGTGTGSTKRTAEMEAARTTMEEFAADLERGSPT